MYISDVIKLAKNYYPSEYDEREMYIWCDEVSAMLSVEDRVIYAETEITLAADGSAALPEGVYAENILLIIRGGQMTNNREIKFTDNSIILPPGQPNTARIVYSKPFEPIRTVTYKGAAKVDGDKISLRSGGFVKGDMISILFDDLSDFESYGEVLSAEFNHDDDYPYSYTLTQGALSSAQSQSQNAVIDRIVTDKTVCAPPYDSMYIDYIIAKIKLYQHDTEGYNHHMTSFNSRLGAYKRWLVKHLPCEGDGKLKNWWQGR